MKYSKPKEKETIYRLKNGVHLTLKNESFESATSILSRDDSKIKNQTALFK